MSKPLPSIHPLLSSAVMAAAAMILLPGCIHQSRVKERPVDPPKSFSSAKGKQKAPPVGRFWRLFSDPALNKLVERALKRNLDLVVAAARVEEAGSALVGARSGWFPKVMGKGDVSRSARTIELPDFTGQGGSNVKREVVSNSYSLSLQVSYEIDLWGKVRYGYQAAKAALLASKEDLQAARISVAATLTDAYFTAVGLRAQVALTRETIKARQNSLKVVERRYREGISAALDLYQARDSLAMVRSTLPGLEQRLRSTEHAISVLVGDFPRQGIAGSLGQLPEPIRELPAGVPAQLLQRRPDLRAAHARLTAADAQVGKAFAAHFPSINIGGSVGVSFDPAALIWNVLAGLTAPIFNGLAISAEVDRQEARFKQALAGYKSTLLKAVQEVEDALVSGDKLLEKEKRLQERVTTAQAMLRLAVEQYLQGLVPYINVLTAEQSLFNARASLISARRELISARIKLARALAGGWKGKAKSRANKKDRGKANAS